MLLLEKLERLQSWQLGAAVVEALGAFRCVGFKLETCGHVPTSTSMGGGAIKESDAGAHLFAMTSDGFGFLLGSEVMKDADCDKTVFVEVFTKKLEVVFFAGLSLRLGTMVEAFVRRNGRFDSRSNRLAC